VSSSHETYLEDGDFDTILSSDIDFTGKLEFEKPFLIRGKVTGEISSMGVLVVDEEAVVNANINARHVLIRGKVKGDVKADSKLEITLTGKLAGNVVTPEIMMESGCVFNGYCVMPEKEKVQGQSDA